MAFETMPFLFFEAGDIMGALSGFIWFGLLFIAGITSSLAMGTPWMGFMKDEFNWGANKSAISFGLVLLAMGLPTIMFYDQGVFGEYDFWTGTAALVIFATAESILFAWIFGINRGWAELQKGADLKVPGIFKYIMLTVTPVMLIVLFTTAVFKPAGGNWGMIMDGKWEFADNSIVGMIGNKGIKANRDYKSNVYESDVAGTVATVAPMEEGGTVLEIEGIKQYYRSEFGNPLRVNSLQDLEPARKATVYDTTVIIQTYTFPEEHEVTVSEGETVTIGDPVAKGEHYNKIFYLDMARLYLLALFVSICIIVYRATMLRFKTGRIDELDPNG
jgi:hypothetical protein